MIFVFKFSVLFFLGQLCSIRVRLSSLFQDKRVVGEETEFSPICPCSESTYHVIIMLRAFAKTKEINACVSEK